MGNNGHSAIDSLLLLQELQNMKKSNQIDPSTLKSVKNQYVNAFPIGDLEKIQYGGQTFGGRDVNIVREVPGFPTDSRRSGDFSALLEMVKQNPNFADTLSKSVADERMQPEQGILKTLMNLMMGN